MNVLALTHAHLNMRGLSPVSCERADSLTGTWAAELHWHVDVVHTRGSKWAGIWPDGKGLKINIIDAVAPEALINKGPELFKDSMKKLLTGFKFLSMGAFVARRASKRIRGILAKKGLLQPEELVAADKWGLHLSRIEPIRSKKYDFIFACVGYGDEYLLQTALTLSKKLNAPMVVDFRDLWSDHHDPGRLTEKQKQQIRGFEKKLLTTTKLISVPQQHMMTLLNKWVHVPVYHLAHSAYVDPNWPDGTVINNEFRMLYAGKLYAGGPGIRMLLELIQQLVAQPLHKPLTCEMYVDDTATLSRMAKDYGVSDYVQINEWISPAELWKRLRSAHVLLIPDSGVAENYPILPTKTFQYAYTGRQLLCLLEFKNDEMKSFLDDHHAGLATTNIAEAVQWTRTIAAEADQYKQLPALRPIPQRDTVAVSFGKQIESIIAKAG